MQITSATELDFDAVHNLKNSIKQDLLSEIRDEMLKKDTVEIVLFTDKEFKYQADDGKVYTMIRVK